MYLSQWFSISLPAKKTKLLP